MNILNRGFITVTPKQDFWDWANKIDTEFQFSEEDAVEPNVYLITEDFFDEAPLLEQHFKKIFKNELMSVSEDDSEWPEIINLNVFQEWFSVQFGSMVFDLEKSNVLSEKI